MNAIILTGRLTREPELRHTQQGRAVTNFTLAVDRAYRRGQEKETDFIDCVAFGQTAEFACKYFTKGSGAAVRGRIQVRTYDDREGVHRKAVEVMVDDIEFNGSKAPAVSEPTFTDYSDVDDGDLPF